MHEKCALPVRTRIHASDDIMCNVYVCVCVPQEDQLEYLVVFNRCAFYSPYFVTGKQRQHKYTSQQASWLGTDAMHARAGRQVLGYASPSAGRLHAPSLRWSRVSTHGWGLLAQNSTRGGRAASRWSAARSRQDNSHARHSASDRAVRAQHGGREERQKQCCRHPLRRNIIKSLNCW